MRHKVKTFAETLPKPIAVSAMGTPAFITAPSGQITPANLIPMPTQFYRMPNGTLLTSMPSRTEIRRQNPNEFIQCPN